MLKLIIWLLNFKDNSKLFLFLKLIKSKDY
jgi:hypothetical protein